MRRFIGGFIIGLIMGGVCGILFSPYSGKEIRKKIIDKTKQSVNKIKNKLKKTKEE